MDTAIVVAKDQLHHFSHRHPLSLVHLQQPIHKDESDDDEDEDKDDIVEEVHHGGQCHMCKEQIWSFHLSYYYCKSCDYSLHKFCAELPESQSNHPLHPGHKLTQIRYHNFRFKCNVCNRIQPGFCCYICHTCGYSMDITCATMSQQKINHPSHPHQLQRMFMPIVSRCVACGNKHKGVFFQCTVCPWILINLDCALLPAKLLIQIHTNESFSHTHPLTLAYSFPESEIRAKFYPSCRVCDGFLYPHLWIYKCEKCIYYVHVDCATSKRDPFMSIIQPASLGKTYKNFKEDEHPNLLHCPFPDEGDNLLKRHMSNEKEEFVGTQHNGEMLDHSSHEHPLILFDKQTPVGQKLHDPMKKVQLLCDGCVKPIMTVPFYMCSQYVDEQCCFVLHEWCAKLAPEMQGYVCYDNHTPIFLSKVPNKFFGVFTCKICKLPSNGFAYGCTLCEDYVDINCAFIPEEITHEAHPNHLLSKVNLSTDELIRRCKACKGWIHNMWGFQCLSCDFYIHLVCALLLPKVIKHKCDEHPLSLRYEPVENHISEYFCEICEEKLNPWRWFYHCTTCAQSMHATCVPVKLQYEQARREYDNSVHTFLNVKFGGTLKIKGHLHRLAFVQGLESDGCCIKCHRQLWYEIIFKCSECKFALHYECAKSMLL